MRHAYQSLCAATLLALAGTASAGEIDVMTQNQYVGMDLIGLVAPGDFNTAVASALKDRAASLPAERAKALAALIGKRNPSLVGLQEVYAFTCVDENPNDQRGCEHQSIAGAFTDQLDDTLEALGNRYVEAATVVNLNLAGIPVQFDDRWILIGVVDRDVILARRGIQFSITDFWNHYDDSVGPTCLRRSADGCNYVNVATDDITIPGVGDVDVAFERGFVGIDATVNGRTYRFVNTHLETRLEAYGPRGLAFQALQAAELRNALASMEPADQTIVVGDFNSDPRDPAQMVDLGDGVMALVVPPYLQFAMSGFTDVWVVRQGQPKGKAPADSDYTCCQDEDLANRESELYERIDLIFSASAPRKVLDARLFGESLSDKTLPRAFGVWPSDHASVAAKIQY